MRMRSALALLLVLAVHAVAQSGKAAVSAKDSPHITFTDVTRRLGINWSHTNGATAEKYLIESMGGGAAFLDYDRDGRLDIFLVNSGCHKFSGEKCVPGRSALYHQNADGTFSDVTAKAGLANIHTYGMG